MPSNLSPSEELRLLSARMEELKRMNAVGQSSGSSAVYLSGQQGGNVNGQSGQNDQSDHGPDEADQPQQHQQKHRDNDNLARMEVELRETKHLCTVTKLELENKALQNEMKQQQMMAELSSMKTQVEKIGQKQQQQTKEQQEKQEDAKSKYASIDQFTHLQNDQKTLLEKVEQMGSYFTAALEEQQKKEQQEDANGKYASIDQFTKLQNDQKTLSEKVEQMGPKNDSDLVNFIMENFTAALEEQQKKIGVLENFVSIVKERFGNELSKSVHPNFRLDFAEKLSIPSQNCWDANACHKNLTISGPNKTMVLYKENTNSSSGRAGFLSAMMAALSSDPDCSLFAKNPIPQENSGIFYYELEIFNVRKYISIGLATKAMPLNEFVGLTNGCGYRISKGCGYRSDGLFYIDTFCWDYKKADCSRGDVIGIGINLATRRLIFTKNGQQLDPSDLFFPPSADRLFPCVSLGSSGDKIEANFGPNFKFDFFKTITKIVSIPPQKNSWDSSACHGDLEITGAEQLVVNYKKEGEEWRTVFAKCAVPSTGSAVIFYFEMKVINVKQLTTIGLAIKHQTPLAGRIAKRRGTFAYEGDGDCATEGRSRGNRRRQFGDGDTVGIGINLANRHLFFTKNGQRMDLTFVLDSLPSDPPLFPFVSLGDSGDKIEANFGPNFKFDLATLL
ncbi:hypothetical protein niasHT_033954 [Heterodera trifolii]|uniref:B30.2/SPRY domain-containing protein n=1 Tax=Heterodera trifolii TaxID=157864 RepID=A0ABD2IE71_9BILA